MQILERLICNFMWLTWVALMVSRPGARPEERPVSPDSSGMACRCLAPERTILPWHGSYS
jgi:hypothetical protein